MNICEFEVVEKTEYTIIHFRLSAPIEPKDLPLILSAAPVADPKKGVVLSGRGPIWLHSALAHRYHPYMWIAHYDPRLGAIVIESHTPKVEIGTVITVEDVPTD